MMDLLKYYDRTWSLWINQNHNPWMDEVMWFISSATPFLLLILLTVFYANRRHGLQGMWLFLLALLVCFAVADLISVHAFKEVFMRYRPSHHPKLGEIVHLYLQPNGELYRGGLYGFVSSHAANFGALITFAILTFRPNSIFLLLMIVSHFLVIYSRVYLGVHYLSDVLVGSLVGIAVAFTVWKIREKFQNKHAHQP